MASELKSTSLNQKAWRRLKRNKSAMFGLAVILLCVLLSVLAYIISPDNSPSANEQILQLETHPPGFKISILKIQKQGFEKNNFIDGAINGFAKDYTPVPILSHQIENDSLRYEEYR